LATALGGELTVTSRVGEGSRFRATFAASEIDDQNQPVSSPLSLSLKEPS
jgi:hypothetical protein